GADDKWTRLAVASAVPKRAGALLGRVLPTEAVTKAAGRRALIHELSALVGARRDPDEVVGVLESLHGLKMKDGARWQFAGLNGLAEGMSRRGTQLAAFLGSLPASKRPVVEKTGVLLARAAERGKDPALPMEERL